MKKLYFMVALLSILASSSMAQVAVNTDGSLPDNSAMLDVKSTSKGLLPPRISLTAINSALPVTAPVAGLLVYNTAVAGMSPNNVLPGYYFWDGTKWIPFSPPQGTNAGDMLYWNGTQWVDVPVGSNGQILTLTNGVPTWVTSSPTCGTPFTINHIAGVVAPVTKTVIYVTINNIPGEPVKCWITSNLGSDHQAMSVNDATEPSAGWYWQFNRKQGYKHDGTTLTPAWTITSIIEGPDWQSSNDPCKIELGTQWRIPSYTEWYNVDNAGGWTDWTGPWSSGLRLHASGALTSTGGYLNSRGVVGVFWCSTPLMTAAGYNMSFTVSSSSIGNSNKASGINVRCLRDN